jgi:hypothetical protein
MEKSLKTFARKLTDCFVPRNDKAKLNTYKQTTETHAQNLLDK